MQFNEPKRASLDWRVFSLVHYFNWNSIMSSNKNTQVHMVWKSIYNVILSPSAEIIFMYFCKQQSYKRCPGKQKQNMISLASCTRMSWLITYPVLSDQNWKFRSHICTSQTCSEMTNSQIQSVKRYLFYFINCTFYDTSYFDNSQFLS